MSRLRRVLMTGFWSVGSQVVGSLSQLLVVPLFLKVWTEHTYQDWIALSALVSIVTYADGGMQQHVINLLTQKATQEKWDEFRATMASATTMYLIAIGLALLTVAGVCGWLVWSDHFHGRALEHQAVFVAGLLGLQLVVQLLAGFIGGLYRAFGRADISMFLGFVSRLGFLVVTLSVLFGGRGAVALAGAQLAFFASVLIATSIDTRRRYPQSSPTLHGARLGSAIRLLGPSLGFVVISISGGFTIQGTVLVIDALVPTALVAFATTRTIASAVRQLMALFTNASWPELTRIDAEGKPAKLSLAHRMLVKVTGTATIPLTTTLLFCGIDLYAVWTRGRVQADSMLLRLLLLDVMVAVPCSCSSFVLAATSRVRGLSSLFAAIGVVQVVLSIVAIKLVGAWGVGAAVLTTTTCLAGTLVPKWTSEVLKEPVSDYVKRIYLPYAVVAAGTACVTWAADTAMRAFVFGPTAIAVFEKISIERIGAHDWQTVTRAVGDGLLSLIGACVLSWLVFFRGDERQFLRSTVESMLRRRRQGAAVATVGTT